MNERAAEGMIVAAFAAAGFADSRKATHVVVYEGGSKLATRLDGTEKQADRKLVRRMQWNFTHTMVGRQRTQWIVPVPLFVESDMAYGVQVAGPVHLLPELGVTGGRHDPADAAGGRAVRGATRKVDLARRGIPGRPRVQVARDRYLPNPHTAR